MTIFDHYKLLDPAYGYQAHQRSFIDRMDRAQALHPCTRDHVVDGDRPPVHTTACYPCDAKGRMVGS